MKILLVSLALLASAVLFADPVNLLKPANIKDSWRFETAGESKGEMVIVEDAVEFRTTATDDTDWHVQAVQTGLELKNGTTYTIKFKARSPEEVTMAVNAMIDEEDWHQIGLREEFQMKKEFKDYSVEFTASETVDKKNRISFVLGYNKGSVFVKDLTMVVK